ncbi:MAG: hypothetical protein O7F73_11485 [Gammaproteobacteria bacterium]|nr:hypothetical protein [Gammaproteobacteria bacterium]
MKLPPLFIFVLSVYPLLALAGVHDPRALEADAAYAQAMGVLVQRYPEDLEAATLYAAAIMNTNPWDYWYRDGTPKPHTRTVLETLTSVLEREPQHAAANHYWIHTVEAYRPELGEAAADRLRPPRPRWCTGRTCAAIPVTATPCSD